MSDKVQEEDKKTSFKPLYIFFSAIIALWVLTWILVKALISGPSEQGQFGDMFGSVNALFSGLALAGIIFTILLQKDELGLQREELRETRQEFIKQNATLQAQKFENTFFHLIEMHREVIDHLQFVEIGITKPRSSLNPPRDTTTILGREVLKRAAIELNDCLTQKARDIEVPAGSEFSYENAFQAITEGYRKFFYQSFNRSLEIYFRSIYHIFKFIYTTHSSDEKAIKFYAALIRAQLSQTELKLLFYNSIVPGFGYPNATFLIRELDILQNFDYAINIEGFKFHKEIFLNQLESAEPTFTVK